MSTRKPAPRDVYLDAWNEVSPKTPRERKAAADEYRLIELRQQAEFDAMEPMNEFVDAFTQHNLDN